MDYKPRQSYQGNSYTYKKKRIFWFNSAFNDDFTVINGKIDDITFNVPQFQTYKNNNLKLLTFVREDANAKPIIIKLKEPYLASGSVINTDKENYPIIYANHTGVEAMTSKANNFDLTPQQIPKFVFKFDDTINKLTYNSYFSSVVNGSLSQVAGGSPDDKILIFNSSGSFVLSRNLTCDILIVGGGGGGGGNLAGGGGGGAVLYTTNLNLSLGSYTITVGSGGAGGTGISAGTNGGDSSIIINGITYTAKGGGGGGNRNNDANGTGTNGLDGGSGGGGSHTNLNVATLGGSSTKNDYSNWISLGNSGGRGIAFGTDNPNNKHLAGGGGGAGSVGVNASISSDKNIGYAGNGGSGANLSSIFGTSVGVSGGLFAGGGGGSFYGATSTNFFGIGNAGGGNGSSSNATSGLANTGGGGGGGGYLFNGGAGGSGVVIIKFRETRINGITAGETLVQATNSSITVVENSKYLINYQNPTNIPTGTYETIFSNGSILFRNKKFPRPWGAYFAEDWSGTTLLDSSGNGRHATSAGTITKTSGFGNGANGNINYLTGTTTSSITWPTGSIPTTFTILTLARWNGTTTANYQRIFDGSSGNWFQGHIDIGIGANSKQIGGAYYNVWITSDQPTTSLVPSITDWVCMIGRNSGTIPNNLLANGIPRGIATGGTSGTLLTINNGTSSLQRSDWAMSVVLIWDTALSDNQMIELNRLIDDYKNTGRSIKNDLGLNFDYSYPILKDANGDTINPIVWYKFDNDGITADASGNGYNLTNSGLTNDLINYVKGNGSVRSVISANTDKIYITSPNFNLNTINSINGITFSFWFRSDSTSSSFPAIFDFSGASTGITLTKFGATTDLYFINTPITAGQSVYQTSTTNFFNNNWYHIVWSISATGIWNIYVNNSIVLNNSSRNIINIDYTNTVNYVFLNRSPINSTNPLKCNIDDFRIYPLTLSATQVSELYNGRVSIYNPPNFEIGLEMNDVDLVPDNTISPYK